MEKGKIIMICGLPGAGKTTLAKKFEKSLPAIRLCPDEWLAEIFGNKVNEKHKTIRDALEKTLLKHGKYLANQGLNVILENGFWRKSERDFYRNSIKVDNLKVELHYLPAPVKTLIKRVSNRNKEDYPFKIPKYKFVGWQLMFEPPTEDEGKSYNLYKKYSGK